MNVPSPQTTPLILVIFLPILSYPELLAVFVVYFFFFNFKKEKRNRDEVYVIKSNHMLEIFL